MNYSMKVEFNLNEETQEIEVRTDGSLMGRYNDWELAGKDLGDEFRHRMTETEQ